MSRLVAIGAIWVGCALAWTILGASIADRSAETTGARGEEVHGLWGAPLRQAAPTGTYVEASTREETKSVRQEGEPPVHTTITRVVEETHEVPLQSTDILVRFELEHRRRGLVWFPTYTLVFEGIHEFRNPSRRRETVSIAFPLDVNSRTYDDLQVLGENGQPVELSFANGHAVWSEDFAPSQTRRYTISFRTRGTESWTYAPTNGEGGEARNLRIRAETDFPNIDFPLDTVSPSSHAATRDQWLGEWKFQSLITKSPIGIKMPQKLNPGPLAAKITFFAPVSLLFFFFVVSMLTIVSRRELHPMHYFLLGCAFFAFHLLFAYLVDHMSLLTAFGIAAATSMLLVGTYSRLFLGWRFALTRVVPVQFIYLVLFSASFFWHGFTGLSIAIGAILTLFVVMQLTGRLDWNDVFSPKPAPAEA